MPIHIPIQIRRISQQEFGEIAYEVTGHAFDIHDEFGRFCNEGEYQQELKARIEHLRTEIPITITHRDFSKQYFLDAFVGEGGLFELKCVEKLHSKHRAQLTHYLLLTGLAHGKLINYRPLEVEHEFVNCETSPEQLRRPAYQYVGWPNACPVLARLAATVRALVEDWGTGLLSDLYAESITHLIGQDAKVAIHGTTGLIGSQAVSLLDPMTALKVTAMRHDMDNWRVHTTKWLRRTDLESIAWVNMQQDKIHFEQLKK